ncbi:MAG TPA: hypothetical protein VGJ17_06025 [Candidatus Limnocylindrales bacterium]|jgi:hypothetical protein
MGTTDQPLPPEERLLRAGPPDLIRVERRDGRRPAIAVTVAAALIVALAVWKPWEPGAGPARALSTVGPGAAGALLPAVTFGPDTPTRSATAAASEVPTYAGLDLSVMGTVDPHADWGVALGYVSQDQFDLAAHGTPIVAPVVTWQPVAQGRTSPGPILDRPGLTAVAIAATWPALASSAQPVSLRLIRFRNVDGGPSGGRSSEPAAAVEIPLTTTLDEVVGSGVAATSAATMRSGRFFIPPALSEDVVAWPNTGWPTNWQSHGWPAGRYEFDVAFADGGTVELPFVIAFGRTP